MPLKTVTFRAPEEKVAALDQAAAIHQRDRTFIINEAVDQYLSLQEYHRDLIEERVRALNAGAPTLDHETAVKMMADMSKKAKRKAR